MGSAIYSLLVGSCVIALVGIISVALLHHAPYSFFVLGGLLLALVAFLLGEEIRNG